MLNNKRSLLPMNDKLPTFCNREQLANKTGCASTLIARIHRAGFLPEDARDIARRPLWFADKIAHVRRMVQFIKERQRNVSALKWMDHDFTPSLSELAHRRQFALKRLKEHELHPNIRTPEVVTEWRRIYGRQE
jgi:hypothetical protein